MKPILIVDDDELLLDGYVLICGTAHLVHSARSGGEALEKLGAGNEYAVVISDMNMPVMTGAELLAQVRLRWPDTVRVMLTANREQETAVAAVNEASVFRFLNKPCAVTALLQAVKDAVRQHELIVAEKELLEKTVNGSVQVLAELISAAEPSQSVCSQKLRDRATAIARQLKWENIWEIEVAATLRRIGSMTIPGEILEKSRRGQLLTLAEQQMVMRIPEIGSAFLGRIPRMEGVAGIVLYQAKHFDGGGFPKDRIAAGAIPPGARLIKVLNDLINLEAKRASRETILAELASRTGWYDPSLLAVVTAQPAAAELRAGGGLPVSVKNLRLGQTLAADLLALNGVRLVAAGYVVTATLLERLENFAASVGVVEPAYIESPKG